MLNRKEEDKSGSALLGCMNALGFTRKNPGASFPAIARFRRPDSPLILGNVNVTFDVRSTYGYPELNCGEEIRGYGIQHDNYLCRFQKFEFDPERVELRITDDGYDFILNFAQMIKM
jgi:hypothetical protein